MKNRKIEPIDSTFQELEKRVYSALQRYANVHRGAGHFSKVTTALFEHARNIVLEYFGVNSKEFTVVFGSKWGLDAIKRGFGNASASAQVFSNDLGLPLGVGALALKNKDIRKGIPFPRGGGVVRLVSRNYILWEDVPALCEAGTPNIFGVITLAVALKMIMINGDATIFQHETPAKTVENILHDDEFRGDSGSSLLSRLLNTRIGKYLSVPTSRGWVSHTYFDNASTTPTFAAIWDVARTILRQTDRIGNNIVKEVKGICARFFNAPGDQYKIFFTQNTTEGINIVAEYLSRSIAKQRNIQHVVLTTFLEHNSNDLPWRYIPGLSILRMNVDSAGFLNLIDLEKVLHEYNHRRSHGRKRITLVAMSGCSNICGSINDIERISDITHRYNSRILIDAAQLAAHHPVDVQKANIDYLVFSGHKMYAPFGSGGLIVRKESFEIEGSFLDEIAASGKENVVGIGALGKAMELFGRIGMDVIADAESRLIKQAFRGFRSIPGLQVFSDADITSDNSLKMGPAIAFSMRNAHHNFVAKMLAEREGIAVRNGCLCAHLFVKQLMRMNMAQRFLSNVSMRMFPKITREYLPGILRASFGIINTEEEVDHFIHALESIATESMPAINKFFSRFYYGTPSLPKTAEESEIEDYIRSTVERVYS
jgi:selenocysteine lyase/cysteine desulfurase